MMKNEYTVLIPVSIEANDEYSLADAKRFLRRQFYSIISCANMEGLQWQVTVSDAKLKRKLNEQSSSE